MQTVYPSARIVGRENIRFGDPVLVDDVVFIMARDPIVIGYYVHLACFSSITDDITMWGFDNSTLNEQHRNTGNKRLRERDREGVLATHSRFQEDGG